MQIMRCSQQECSTPVSRSRVRRSSLGNSSYIARRVSPDGNPLPGLHTPLNTHEAVYWGRGRVTSESGRWHSTSRVRLSLIGWTLVARRFAQLSNVHAHAHSVIKSACSASFSRPTMFGARTCLARPHPATLGWIAARGEKINPGRGLETYVLQLVAAGCRCR